MEKHVHRIIAEPVCLQISDKIHHREMENVNLFDNVWNITTYVIPFVFHTNGYTGFVILFKLLCNFLTISLRCSPVTYIRNKFIIYSEINLYKNKLPHMFRRNLLGTLSIYLQRRISRVVTQQNVWQKK